MNYCKNFTGLTTKISDDKTQRLIHTARCKQWNCEYCARQNKKHWRAVLLDAINKSGKQWAWFTLTSNLKAQRANNSIELTRLNLQSGWGKIVKRMVRKYGKFSYCRVFERHASGNYHIHCVCSFQFDDIVTRNKGKRNQYNDSKWLRQTAPACGLGFMTHADNIGDNAGLVAGYVTKYMTKIKDEDVTLWKKVRRIQTSRDIKYNTPKTTSGWEFWHFINSDDVLDHFKRGIEIYSITEDKTITLDDFEHSNIYPPTSRKT